MSFLGFLILGVAGVFLLKVETDYFSEHRDEILTAVRADLESHEYDAVIETADKYSVVGDPELERLRRDAEQAKKEGRLAALRDAIAEASDLSVKRKKLEKLLELAPDDSDARQMLAEIEPEPPSNVSEANFNETYIPGLAAVGIYENLVDKGFEIEKEFIPAFTDSGIKLDELYIWNCTKEDARKKMFVTFSGPSESRITTISAQYWNYSREDTNQGASEFLGYVATVPYEGSKPSRARSWTAQNMGKNATTKIADVSFELVASAPRVRALLIQPATPDALP